MSEITARQRIGLLGGTFDPIHIGHLLIAEHAREQLRLDQVRFIPAASAPHKPEHRAADAKQRLEMIRLAISGNPYFAADDRELLRGGTSYTVDTLSHIRAELPQSELIFIMGADSLAEFHSWREPRRICQLAWVVVVARGGHAAPDLDELKKYLPTQQLADVQSHQVLMPQIEISASDIRTRIAQSRTVRYQLHPAVEAYIAAQGLYRG